MPTGFRAFQAPGGVRVAGAPSWQPFSLPRLDAPFGSGRSSGNHKIGQAAGANRLVYRFVPKKTGTLFDVWIETRARSGPACSPQLTDADSAESSSYSAGNPNNWLWEVRFHPIVGRGWFDPATDLVPARQFNPYFQRRQTSQEITSTLTLSALKIPAGDAGFSVTRDVPIAMTIAPANADPATDYASANQLYTDDGLEGAQSRNEVSPGAPDALYGVDPRLVMGGSNAAGSSQWYPGNNFNAAPFAKHLPCFLLVYSDGVLQGQPYFSAATQSAPVLGSTQYVMNYVMPAAGVCRYLGVTFNDPGTVTATVALNATDKASVVVTGAGVAPHRVVRKALPSPFAYAQGDTITVTFSTSVDGVLARTYSNGVFSSLLGQGSSFRYWLTGDTLRVVPVMPLPYQFPQLIAGPSVHAAPATPSGFTATAGSGSVALAWTTGEAWVQNWELWRDSGSGYSLLTSPTTNSYSDTAVTGGTAYNYKLKAVAKDGRASGFTSVQSATPSTPAAIAYVGARGTLNLGGATGSLTQIVPVSAGVTAGNKLVVAAGGRNSSAVLSGVTDTQSNTYVVSIQKQDAGSNNTVAIAIGQMTTALTTSDTVTLTWSPAIGPARMAELHEFSGVKASTATDQTFSAGAGSTSTAVSIGPSGATLQAVEVVIAALVSGTASLSSTLTGTSGYATLGSLMKTSGATSGDREVGALYKIIAATGTQTATGTLDVANSVVSVLATLKGA